MKTQSEKNRVLRQYYEKVGKKTHLQRTELAIKQNKTGTKVAVDCGCGTGNDINFLAQNDYTVYGYDKSQEAVSICKDRFSRNTQIEIVQSSFESCKYPASAVVIANSSLYFAEPSKFELSWQSITNSLITNGVFAGDFMGLKDDWATGFHSTTCPLSEKQVKSLFERFEVVHFSERNERGTTALGVEKHWNTYSVVAVKCAS